MSYKIELMQRKDRQLIHVGTFTADYLPAPGDKIIFVEYDEMEECEVHRGKYRILSRLFYTRRGDLEVVGNRFVPTTEPYKHQYEPIRFIVQDADEADKQMIEYYEKLQKLPKVNRLKFIKTIVRGIPYLVFGIGTRLLVWLNDSYFLGKIVVTKDFRIHLPRRIEDIFE